MGSPGLLPQIYSIISEIFMRLEANQHPLLTEDSIRSIPIVHISQDNIGKSGIM